MTFEEELATQRELASLRSQLSACQRERDDEKRCRAEAQIAGVEILERAESAEQQLQQMTEALKGFLERSIRRATWTDRDVDECRECKANDAWKPLEHDKDCPVAAARELLKGKGE